jgi:lipoyl(octanoyl) transferase
VLEFRLFVDPPLPGAWNMGVDEVLLLDAADNGVGSVRFYQWREPTLSLGYFQRYCDRETHSASRACAVVRRQTGGGAIMHDHELTYSLTLPSIHPLARQRGDLYAAVHEAFIVSLATIIGATADRWHLQCRGLHAARVSPGNEPFLCFQREAPGDVVAAATKADPDLDSMVAGLPEAACKVLGSAQRRYRGAVLQHGSLLLKGSAAAPELPGINDLTRQAILAAEIGPTVAGRLGEVLGVTLLAAELPADLQSKARELANNKYSSATWTKRR